MCRYTLKHGIYKATEGAEEAIRVGSIEFLNESVEMRSGKKAGVVRGAGDGKGR